MPVQLVSISADGLTVGKLKEALARYDDLTLVSNVSELRRGTLGIITFLIEDVSTIEGLFLLIEHFNRTGEWVKPPVVEQWLYKAKVVRDSALRNAAGVQIGELLKAGSVVSVYSTPAMIGGFPNRVWIDPPSVALRLHIYFPNLLRL